MLTVSDAEKDGLRSTEQAKLMSSADGCSEKTTTSMWLGGLVMSRGRDYTLSLTGLGSARQDGIG
jgi:hypothetical protein